MVLLMNSLLLIFRNIKNIFPYLLLIILYFIFINIEAQRDKTNSKIIQNRLDINNDQIDMNDINMRLKIQVITFDK